MIEFISFSSDGKFFISRSPSEAIIWNTKDWKDLITIEEDFGIVTSAGRRCQAFIHDGLYKPFNNKILSDFSDEIEIVEEEQNEKVSKQSDETKT